MTSESNKDWYVYILRCSDNSLYTGITTNIDRRVAEHNSQNAAKYTRSRQPVQLVYYEKVSSRSQASVREYEIKKLSKQDKELLKKSTDNLATYD